MKFLITWCTANRNDARAVGQIWWQDGNKSGMSPLCDMLRFLQQVKEGENGKTNCFSCRRVCCFYGIGYLWTIIYWLVSLDFGCFKFVEEIAEDSFTSIFYGNLINCFRGIIVNCICDNNFKQLH